MSDIPEVPAFVATRQYLRACRELCEKARVWRVDSTMTVSASAEQQDLTTLFPDNTELVDVISIKPSDGSTPVTSKTQAWLDINWSDWRTQESLIAQYYVLEENNIIRFIPTPSEAVTDAYYLRAAIKPTLSATSIDSLLVNKYSEILISGAKAYLFMTPRKPWTDLQLAQYHQAAFLGGIPDARAEAADEFQTGVARKVKYGGL
jgi:hypothetical protein